MEEAESIDEPRPPPPKRGGCLTDQIAAEKHSRDIFIKVSLRELLIYSIYFTCLCVAAFATVNTPMYYYTYVLRRLFTESKFHTVEGTEINMGGINSMEQVWGYLSQVVARCSDWHFWYSTDAKVAETDIEDRNVLFDNRIIGTPRVRQVRVTNHSCKVPDDFKVLFTRCYGFFSSSNEETGNIPVDSDAGDSAWVYHKASDLGSYSYSGIVATYSGGGFYKDLVQSSPTDRAAMTLLKNKLWISRATRAIFIDLATYNGNINVFCIVKLVFEFPPTGGVIPSANFNTMKLLRYHSISGILTLLCEVVVGLFTLFFIFEEVIEILAIRTKYFSSWWTYLDLTILVLLVTFIVTALFRAMITSGGIKKAVETKAEFFSFDRLILIQSIFNYVIAFLVFFSALKFLRYLKMNLVMNRLLTIIYESSPALFGFALIFLIILFAFALLGHLLFGTEVRRFSSVFDSLFSLHLMLLGDINYQELVNANRIVGPIFFCTYIFFIFFILLNMFLAIINERFWAKNKQIDLDTEDTLGIVLKRSLQNCLNMFGCKGLVGNWKQRDENNKGLIRMNRLKSSLQRSGFSDAEIATFFEKYEVDEDTLSADNADDLIQRLKNDLQGLGAFDSTVQERIMYRINTIENTLLNIHKKLDNIAFRLKMS